ncbi:MAG: hypothetical protein QG621_699 [Patescibacteria group bacterium]|nr:hypothetical protein [Patescibacteria group bacterium]
MGNPRIIICRHAESLEDVDNNIYDTMRDLDIPLTEKGIQQARLFGGVLTQLLRRGRAIQFFTSPGVRNVQTLEIVVPMLPNGITVEVVEEPLIVKQDWGIITAENRPWIEADRYRTGVLRYTFPTGESAANLIARLTMFKDKLFRLQEETGNDVVIFSHGFEFRVLLMIIFGWDEELFESFGNLDNCEYRMLTMNDGGTYELDRPLKQHGLPITRLKEKS